MGTELTPSRRSISIEMEKDGRPIDNGLFVPTTDQLFHFGKRIITWDGKVFKYAKAGAPCRTGRGNVFYNAIPATGIDYSHLAADADVGDHSIVMTNGDVLVQIQDCLVGGQICLKVSDADTNVDATLQMRTVVGNDAAAKNAKCRIYLDAPLNTALTALAGYAFVMPSPWSDIRYIDDISISGYCSHAGPAAAYMAAGDYGFIQTYGKCWLAPLGGVGETQYGREVVWRYNGTIQYRGATALAGLYGQLAGFIMDNNVENNGSTMIFLQGDCH